MHMKKNLPFILLITLCGCANLNSTSIDVTTSNDSISSPSEENTTIITSMDTSEEKEDYGQLIIPSLTIYTEFPDKPSPTFTNPNYACEIDYKVLYNPTIYYENGYFYANGESSALVEATTKYHSTTFVVTSKIFCATDGEERTKAYLNRIRLIEQQWNSTKETNGTVFIGDSFFDEYQFFTDFYKLYKGQNAYCHGVSSSRIEDWNVFAKRLIYPLNPKNIVMHIGTNDMFSGKEQPINMLSELKNLFDELIQRLPEVNLYWFAIEPRTYGINSNKFDEYSFNVINEMNLLVKNYCETDERFHYLDISNHCYKGNMIVDSNFFKDGVHPQNDKYLLYCQELINNGLNLPYNEPEKNTTKLTFDIYSTVSSSAQHIKKDGQILNNNFSIKGKMSLQQITTNPHIEFSFDNTHSKNRFLLWDNDANGSFNIGYAIDGVHKNNVNATVVNLNQDFTFEIVSNTTHAFLYINDTLQLVFRNVNHNFFTISSNNAKAEINEISILISSDSKWQEIMSRKEITQQVSNQSNTKEIIIL